MVKKQIKSNASSSKTVCGLETSPILTRCISEYRVYVKGPGKSNEFFELSEEEVVLGRDNDVGFTLPDENVSRNHARLFWHRGAHYVEDLESTNGTSLNSVCIESAELKSNDHIRIGPFVLTYLILENPCLVS